MSATWDDMTATWEDLEPVRSRSYGLYLLGTVVTLLLLTGAALVTVPDDLLPTFEAAPAGAADQQQPVNRNEHLAAVCASNDSDAELAELAQSLCACVDDSENPEHDCRDEFHRWALWRDVARCEGPELRTKHAAYCRCVAGVARIVELADTDALARRRSHRYQGCRHNNAAPALPTAG
jgi:hypothetical protein